MVKATAIDPSVVGPDQVYRHRGPARVFLSEQAAIKAIKGQSEPPVKANDVVVLIGAGPLGTGMEETYQLTSALKYVPWGKHVAIVTDARFSGVSTGACIGHVGPEALAGGPIGKLRDGDIIEIAIDRKELTGTINLVAENGDGDDLATGEAAQSAGGATDPSGTGAAPGAARGHAAVGRPSAGQRRNLGRVCLRRRPHRAGDRGRHGGPGASAAVSARVTCRRRLALQRLRPGTQVQRWSGPFTLLPSPAGARSRPTATRRRHISDRAAMARRRPVTRPHRHLHAFCAVTAGVALAR